MIKWIAYACFLGSFLAFGLGTLGLFRFPDSYTRMHAVGMGDTLGVGLAVLGLLFLSPGWSVRIKLIVIMLLFWLINTTMTHLVAKAGLIHGVQPTKETKLRKG
ncbi:MAG: monovalent cation/H(+) antiporter subunit G [Acetivibrionales bacterium]|jgi:multicomponent Na+:H+ antiporter subunit G|nr:monovalent cation/H(+) antiporter subunit G [Bacillota bacterium]NLP08391.1 monovalent cation/H(+) antiporter subunit G [Clostridiaceae bacterium]HOA54221.1 monovalent cation/H(+) antiporter subunit G [Clostridiales bacterium]HQD31891.1 monovalent cation/H(+) antiporter subunit G [Clostridiales bacterium]